MQPGEEIESLVDELEQIVSEAKSPLTGGGQKKIVDAQDIYEILDEIREAGWEGCLSVPGLRGLVERPAHIRYSGTDLDGNAVTRIAKGFHARVVQHECDHLDGVLYPQRMGDLTRLIFESEVRHHLQPQD